MFAVIKTGGRQYKVAKNTRIRVGKIDGIPGAKIQINDVLMIGSGIKAAFIGTPVVSGAIVTAEIIKQTRDDKVIIFKKKRRHNYRRKAGHKQDLTELKILDIKKGDE